MAKLKKTDSARTTRKRKAGYRKGYGKRKNMFKKKYGRRSRYPQETARATRHTHTMICEMTSSTTDAATNLAFRVNHSDANLAGAWQALAGMLHLSSKHYQLELSPLLLDLSYLGGFYQNLNQTLIAKHKQNVAALSGVPLVPASQPDFS